MVLGAMQDFGALSPESMYTETPNGRKIITTDLISSLNGWTSDVEADFVTFYIDNFNQPILVSFAYCLFLFFLLSPTYI
jgi:hypothetical protein